MSLDLFLVIPADLPQILLDTPIKEELTKHYIEEVAALLKLARIEYNQKEVIKKAIKLNQPIILRGLIRKKLVKKEKTKSNVLSPNTLLSHIMDDDEYKENLKGYLNTVPEDEKPQPLYQNNRVDFLDEINRKMLSLKFEKDDSSCTKKGDDSFTPLVHQMIVTRYLNSFTPYRGLLLYHGLGSGKTCSSISIIEGMKNTHKVYVMTPASLQANYRTQMKYCGDQLFKTNNYWSFKELPRGGERLLNFYDSVKLTEEFVKFHPELDRYMHTIGGLWVVDDTKEPNFNTLEEDEKEQIDNQITILIKNKYSFINYNGITKKRWNDYTRNKTINPFDHSVLVIDEVHNFVSRIVNKLHKKNTVSTDIYEAIMEAEDCKVVALSGTPYINNPCELGVLFNIIGGYTYCLEIGIKTLKVDLDEKMFKILLNKPFIESFEYDQAQKKLKVLQNPYGFSKLDSGQLIYDQAFISREDFITSVLDLLKGNASFVVEKSQYVKYNKFPDTMVEFNTYFVTPDLKIKNKEWFQSKIVGMVSYLGDKRNLMPDIIKADDGNDIHLEYSDMSLHQIKAYSAIRNDERKKDKRSKKKEEEEFSSTYRVFSRLCCNFSFPDDTPRPMPSNNIVTEEDIDVVENEKLLEDIDGKYDELDTETRKVDDTYKTRIDDVLKKFSRNPELYFNSDIPKLVSGVESGNTLKELSPKFLQVITNIMNPDNIGCHLIYSNFRQLEGIGILSIILKFYGFIELRVEQTPSGNTLVLDGMYNNDRYVDSKKVFALYTGTETPEQKEIIRNIYNSKYDALPNNIQARLKELFPNNTDKNLYGEIIKVFMITASGAEGIDLKNTRFVHILEPYWHHVRVNQVIGRARRICSHADLPEEYRNVTVYMYMSKFKEGMDLEEFNALKTQDNSISTDQLLFNIMERKRGLSVMFLDTLKEASIDCIVNYKDKCVTKPFATLKNRKLTSIDYKSDPIQKFESVTKKVGLVKKSLDTNGKLVAYAVDTSKTPNILYDYKAYTDSVRAKELDNKKEIILVKVGTLIDDKVVLL
jgi:hypothetical protein